jgi:hypothetical protein
MFLRRFYELRPQGWSGFTEFAPRLLHLLCQPAFAIESPLLNELPGFAGGNKIARLRRQNQLAQIARILRTSTVVACQMFGVKSSHSTSRWQDNVPELRRAWKLGTFLPDHSLLPDEFRGRLFTLRVPRPS